jgi:hypothetical protein
MVYLTFDTASLNEKRNIETNYLRSINLKEAKFPYCFLIISNNGLTIRSSGF